MGVFYEEVLADCLSRRVRLLTRLPWTLRLAYPEVLDFYRWLDRRHG